MAGAGKNEGCSGGDALEDDGCARELGVTNLPRVLERVQCTREARRILRRECEQRRTGGHRIARLDVQVDACCVDDGRGARRVFNLPLAPPLGSPSTARELEHQATRYTT